MKEKNQKINDVSNTAEGIRVEYGALRKQISYTDNVCVIIMGFILTASVTLASIAIKDLNLIIISLISPLWFIGFLYFTEKRFIILKTAYYIGSVLEERHSGLGWETWHCTKDPVFRRVDPYHIEATISAIAIIGSSLFIAYIINWDFHNLLLLTLFTITIVFLILLIINIKAYGKALNLLSTQKISGISRDGYYPPKNNIKGTKKEK
ncbi:hypothetical protein BEH94_00995 [Candidatus Altiarchaeales archaeon WOR_SM1_SCG]|nr:hypothetical protein BEH94_00995 [Candidatus Altiarchaeales archaeon WOR_SM1_SCG]